MVELLRQIERRAGRPIWQLFDVIAGTSTGALLAVALGMLRLSLDASFDIYTLLGRKVCVGTCSGADCTSIRPAGGSRLVCRTIWHTCLRSSLQAPGAYPGGYPTRCPLPLDRCSTRAQWWPRTAAGRRR